MKLENYLDTSSSSDDVFNMGLLDILSLDDFTINYKSYTSEYWADIIFLGLKCYARFYFQCGELDHVSFLPKPEEVGYENWSGWPDWDFEKAIRDKVEPLLTEKFGNKIKVDNKSRIGLDSYEWHYDKYIITITKSCSNGRDDIVGGRIIISKRKEK